MDLLPLSSIIVQDRIREDLGDIDELAESIQKNGLLQPIVVDDANNLIDGGRRYTAAKNLGWTDIPFVRLGTLSPARRRMLEIEANMRRKDFTWQERTLGIADYHRLCVREAITDGLEWMQEQTGKLLNIHQTAVSTALIVAKELKNTDSPIWKLSSLFEATKFLAQRKVDEANKELNRRITARRELMATQSPVLTQVPGKSLLSVAQPSQPTDAVVATSKVSREAVSAMFIHGDFRTALPAIAESMTINHIITDPPYAIEMTNLGGGDERREILVERVSETHKVKDNLELIQDFLRISYEVIAEDGFLCMWYDLDHHERLQGWANEIGWLPCRWPLVWCKTSPCMNQAAQYNITKATEVCLLFRRSSKSIIKKKQDKNWILADSASSSSHPFTKPSAVWRYLIETVSMENQIVVDPFCGQGSMMLEAYQLNRLPFGCEIDEVHLANGVSWVFERLNDSMDLITNIDDMPL